MENFFEKQEKNFSFLLDNYSFVSYNINTNIKFTQWKGEQKMNSLALKGKRTSQGKNQRYMAHLIGITVGAYCKRENGQVDFTPDEMTLISNDLDFSLVEFSSIFFDGKLQCCKISQVNN